MSGTGPIAVAFAATIAYHLGLVAEKRALRTLPAINVRRPLRMAVTLVAAPAWLGGFALMLIGFGLQVVALAKAQVTVVQPIIASGVVVLLVVSRIVLRERLGGKELGCVLAIVLAIALLALSDPRSSGQVGRHASGGLVTTVVIVAGIAAALAIVLPDRRRKGRHRHPPNGAWLGCASGLCYGVSALGIKGVASVLGSGHGGGQLIIALVSSGYLYLALGGSAVGLMVFQTALQRHPVSIVGPVSNVTGSVFFLIAGTALFGEQLPDGTGLLAARLAGVALACVAVAVLSARSGASAEGAGTDDRRHAAWSPAVGEHISET